MIPVQCDQVGHQGSPISALCLRQDCTIKSSYCTRCVKLHRDCTDHLKFLDEIPEAMSQLKTLRNWFRDSFDSIKQLIAKLEKIVNQHFLPIDEYAESPTLTNLNRLGQMLKDTKPQEIQGLEQQKEKICKDLDQFRDMLSNRKEQFIQQIVPVVLSQKDKDLIEEYWSEGWRLYWGDKYQESIEFFDKALKIDKNHKESLGLKGVSLHGLSKYQEAIDCFDQIIKIDPQYNSPYYYKGMSLQEMNNHQEAIKCFDESIKLTPDDIYSYQRKGESLRKLFRLKNEEQCYIEGLKHNPDDKNLKKYLSSVQEEMKKQK